jgi:hypothetical protein
MREAIFHLEDTQLEKVGLGDLLATAREAGLRSISDLVWHGSGGILLIRSEEPVPKDELAALDAVDWWERLETSGPDVTYLCEFTIPGLPEEFPLDEHGVTRHVRGVREQGIDVSVVGSQDDISRSVEVADDVGVNVLLERLADYRGPSTPLDSLTERQREVTRTAHEMGYYEVPRQATTDDVAAELGVEASTVVEHLQRAEANLVDRVLSDPEY